MTDLSMRSADSNMLIIIHKYRKRKVTYYKLFLSFVFEILTFSALRVDLCFEKNIETVIICHPIFNER